MALSAPVGAGNKLTIHTLGATGFGAATFTFDKNVTMDYSGHPIKDSLVIDLDSKIDTENLNLFFNAFLNPISVEETKVEYVDASYDTITSGQTAANKFGYIWYGAEGSDGKVKVIMGVGILSGDTGNASYAGKGVGNYPIQITTIAHTAAMIIPTALFDASKVTQATNITLPTSARGTINHFAAA